MANFSTVNGGIILTVPTGKRWVGSVTLSASVSGSAGDTATTAHPSVTVSGVGARDWVNGDTVVALALAVPLVGALSLVGVTATSSATSGQLVIQPSANPISLVLNLPTRVVGNALAAGELL